MATVPHVPYTVIPSPAPTETDPTIYPFPARSPISILDLVGPLAANRQPAQLDKRTVTEQTYINQFCDVMNALSTLFLQRDGSTNWDGTAPLDMNHGVGGANSKIINLQPGTLSNDASTFGQLSAEIARAEAAEALLAPLASPTLTGIPTAPTAAPSTNDTQLATTAYVDTAVSGIAGARVDEHTSSGTFVVPAGISKVMLMLSGGAGGGGGGGGGGSQDGGTGGNGGGGYRAVVAVTPGETLTITIGGGGAGGAPGGSGPGIAGSNSTIAGSFGTVTALGGSGGSPAAVATTAQFNQRVTSGTAPPIAAGNLGGGGGFQTTRLATGGMGATGGAGGTDGTTGGGGGGGGDPFGVGVGGTGGWVTGTNGVDGTLGGGGGGGANNSAGGAGGAGYAIIVW